jgi:hypothetical protein
MLMSTESFIPPKHSIPFLWFLDASLRNLLSLVFNIEDVIIQPSDQDLLKSLKKERVILISNHPSTKEPPITFLIGNSMYSRFSYLAGREVFDWGYGLVGKMIQAVGAYSIIAGTADRESLKMTRKILSSPEGKLVLFPEGEPTGAENDNLLPFQTGVTQMGFWGYEDALKIDPKAEIMILPAFIKYRFSEPIDVVQYDVDKSLERMELKLNISKRGKTIVERLFDIGRVLIEKNEKNYDILPQPDQSFDYRIGQIRHKILNHVADTVGLKKFNREDDAINKLRYILSVFEMVSLGVADPKNELPSISSAKWGREYLQKAYDFISIKTSYLEEFPTAERIYEWIYRFENEIFKSSKPRKAKAYISFKQPIKLSERYKIYKASKNKKQIVDELTMELRNNVLEMLNEEKSKSYELFPNGKVF